MSKVLTTAAEAAADERRLWMRKTREWQKAIQAGSKVSALELTAVFLDYGYGRTKRNNAKAGGQGRAKKAK